MTSRLQPPGAAKLTKSVKGREQLAFYDSVVGWARGGQWDRLLEHDQLLSATGLLDEWGGPDRYPLAAAAAADPEKPVLSVSETRRATKFLYGWREGALQFAPTYSLLIGERLSYKHNRMPSYCDRILSTRPPDDRQLALLSYASSDTLRSSDHAPVAAAYALTVADAHVPTGILSPPVGGGAAPRATRGGCNSSGCRRLASRRRRRRRARRCCRRRAARSALRVGVRPAVRPAGAVLRRRRHRARRRRGVGRRRVVARRPAKRRHALRGAVPARGPVRHAARDRAARRRAVGEDDIVATATVTLLGLPAAATADAATLAFRADSIHATERVGELRGALALARTSAV